MGTSKVVGLALSAGAARGYAHIGVLKVLEREGIPINCIAGSSMGAMVGALYAVGISPDRLAKLALNLKRRHWLDITFPRLGLVSGEKLEALLSLLTRGKRIEELSLPLAVVATDLEKGEEVVLTSGSIARAVRASSAIPGIFAPVRYNGRLLVDGGVLNRVPAQVARDLGADVVIAVNVGMELEDGGNRARVNGIFGVIMQSIEVMQREILKEKIIEADVVIQPQVGHIGITQFERAEECIRAGEKAAEELLPQMKALVD